MLDWWQGTEEEMKKAGKDGTTGFKGVLSGFDKFVESGKELGGKLVELAKRSPGKLEGKRISLSFTDSKREFLHWERYCKNLPEE